MSEGVPDTSHLPFKMGQEVICREGRLRRELGRGEKGGAGGEEFMGVEHICTDFRLPRHQLKLHSSRGESCQQGVISSQVMRGSGFPPLPLSRSQRGSA